LKSIAHFPSAAKVNAMEGGFDLNKDFTNELNKLEYPTMSLSFSISKRIFINCAVENCNATEVKIYHVKQLDRKIQKFRVKSMLFRQNSNIKISSDFRIIESTLNRKQVSLCKKHHVELYTDEIDIQTLKANFFNEKSLILASNSLKTQFKID